MHVDLPSPGSALMTSWNPARGTQEFEVLSVLPSTCSWALAMHPPNTATLALGTPPQKWGRREDIRI